MRAVAEVVRKAASSSYSAICSGVAAQRVGTPSLRSAFTLCLNGAGLARAEFTKGRATAGMPRTGAPPGKRLPRVHEERCLAPGHGQLVKIHPAGMCEAAPASPRQTAALTRCSRALAGPERGPPVVTAIAARSVASIWGNCLQAGEVLLP